MSQAPSEPTAAEKPGTRKGKKNLQRRSDNKLDVAKAFELKMRGLSYVAIAKLQGVSKDAVFIALKRFAALFEDHQVAGWFRENEGLVLDNAKLTLLQHMLDPERLGKSMPNHLAYAYAQLNNAARLARGESTQNVQNLTKLIIAAHAEPVTAKQAVGQHEKTSVVIDVSPVESVSVPAVVPATSQGDSPEHGEDSGAGGPGG